MFVGAALQEDLSMQFDWANAVAPFDHNFAFESVRAANFSDDDGFFHKYFTANKARPHIS